jgi:hypothetical protein
MGDTGGQKPPLNPRRTEEALSCQKRKEGDFRLSAGKLLYKLHHPDSTHLSGRTMILLLAGHFTGMTTGTILKVNQ